MRTARTLANASDFIQARPWVPGSTLPRMDPLQARIWDRLAAVPGMMEGESVFSEGRAFWVNGKQVAHFASPDALELRLTRPVIRELRTSLEADARVEPRSPGSDWVTVRFDSVEDVKIIGELAERVCRAHVPSDGLPP